MAGVSVEKSAVSGAISLCTKTIDKFNQTSTKLLKNYQQAGSTWKDVKYKQLGTIVNDCNSALKKPIAELQSCIEKLNELLATIIEYESTNI